MLILPPGRGRADSPFPLVMMIHGGPYGRWTDELMCPGCHGPEPDKAGLGGSFGWEGPGPHLYDQLSPISYVAQVTAPVLILHDENDTNVPVGQALYFHRALTQFGTEQELVIYPRENHSFTERAHQIDVLERTPRLVHPPAGRSG